MLNLNNIKSISFLLFLSFISIALVLFFIFKNSPELVNPKPVINNTPTSQSISAPQEMISIISGWKVYQNKEYGFRIDYPGDWDIEEDIYKRVYFFPANSDKNNAFTMDFNLNSDNFSLNEWVEKNAYGQRLQGAQQSFIDQSLEAKGLPPAFYKDEVVIDGNIKAVKILELSEGYFDCADKKTLADKKICFEKCPCNKLDVERVFIKSYKSNVIFQLVAGFEILTESGSKAKLVIKNNRYVVESSDPVYNQRKDIFAKLISSFRFTK